MEKAVSDTRGRDRPDDAPLSTSKHEDAADVAARVRVEPRGDAPIGRAVTINRPRAELYAYWRDFTQLPTFMDNVTRVDMIDSKRSHWVVRAPAGRTVEWDAFNTEERAGETIARAWVDGGGSPAARGTLR